MTKAGFEEIYALLDYSLRNNINDTNFLLYSILLRKYDFTLDNNYLFKQRSLLEGEVIERLKKSRATTQKILSQKYKMGKQMRVSFVQENIVCNKEWQICIYDIEYKFNFASFLVLQVADSKSLDYHENYFFEEYNSKASNNGLRKRQLSSSLNFQSYDFLNLLIERRPHKCGDELTQKSEKSSFENKSLMARSIDLRDKLIQEEEDEGSQEDEEEKVPIYNEQHLEDKLSSSMNLNKLRSFTTINHSEFEEKENNNILTNSSHNKFKELVIPRNIIKRMLKESSFKYEDEINFDEL